MATKYTMGWRGRQRRREEAEDRQIEYDVLTTQEKLERLIPDGSKRQRARLEAQLLKETSTPKKKKAAKKSIKKIY